VFEKHREKKEQQATEQAVEAWQAQHDAYEHVLELARDLHGEPTGELLLKKGEALYGKVDGVSLVEDRAGKGTWKGRSQGVSIPIGSLNGRSVRYRVGASKGHYVQGAPVATPIDTGAVFITNRRVVFRGAKQNRECVFDKLLSVEHVDNGESIFAVSNRQKNTVIHYGPQLNDWFRVRYAVAFADYQGTRSELVEEVMTHLAELERTRPGAVPVGTGTGELPPPPAPTMDGRPAEWAADPTDRHEYRYWDGAAWTEHVSDAGTVGSDPP
jgi:hypothetical protein